VNIVGQNRTQNFEWKENNRRKGDTKRQEEGQHEPLTKSQTSLWFTKGRLVFLYTKVIMSRNGMWTFEIIPKGQTNKKLRIQEGFRNYKYCSDIIIYSITSFEYQITRDKSSAWPNKSLRTNILLS